MVAVIRKLTEIDECKLVDFYEHLPQSITELFLPFGDFDTREQFRDRILAGEDRLHIDYCLFDEEDRIGGHCFVRVLSEHGLEFGIGLAENALGFGYGKALSSEVLREADSLGIEEIYLSVVKANEIAWKLYEKLGFTFTGETTFREPNDSFTMIRKNPAIAQEA